MQLYTESSRGIGEAVSVKVHVKLLFSNSLRVNNICEVRRVSKGYATICTAAQNLRKKLSMQWLEKSKTEKSSTGMAMEKFSLWVRQAIFENPLLLEIDIS